MSRTASTRLFFAILCAAILFPATLSAQEVGPKRSGSQAERMDRRVSTLTERLLLSEDQAAGVRAILEEQYELLKEDRETYGGDREAMREIMMGRMKRADEQIMRLLTDEQKAEYEKYKKERREEMRSRRQRPGIDSR